MKCPRCEAPNREAARFCRDCGVRLDAVCAACRAATVPGSKFCDSCGELIAKARTAEQVPAQGGGTRAETPHLRAVEANPIFVAELRRRSEGADPARRREPEGRRSDADVRSRTDAVVDDRLDDDDELDEVEDADRSRRRKWALIGALLLLAIGLAVTPVFLAPGSRSEKRIPSTIPNSPATSGGAPDSAPPPVAPPGDRGERPQTRSVDANADAPAAVIGPRDTVTANDAGGTREGGSTRERTAASDSRAPATATTVEPAAKPPSSGDTSGGTPARMRAPVRGPELPPVAPPPASRQPPAARSRGEAVSRLESPGTAWTQDERARRTAESLIRAYGRRGAEEQGRAAAAFYGPNDPNTAHWNAVLEHIRER